MNARGRSSVLRRYSPLVTWFAVGMTLLVIVLPSALNLPQPNPTTIAEYAPVPSDEQASSAEGNLSSLGLGSSRGLGSAGANDEEITELPARSRGQLRTTKKCVGSPPRQTEDPMAPPCVAFFDGDNGGKTYQGVTRDEIAVLVYFESGTFNGGDNSETSPPQGSYCDIDKAPNTDPGCFSQGTLQDHIRVRTTRAFSRYFNSRYQTYGRNVHFWGYSGMPATGGTAEERRADASENFLKVRPFGVLDQTPRAPHDSIYADAIAYRDVMLFQGNSWTETNPASFYRKYAPQVWNFNPDVEHAAEMYVDYVCTKVKGHPVSHAPLGVGLDGRPFNTRPRKFGFLWSDDETTPTLTHFADLVRPQLRRCGVVPAAEVTFDYVNYEPEVHAATFKREDVTTILRFGGYYPDIGVAASALGYYPEQVFAADGVYENPAFARLEDPNWFRGAWIISFLIRQDRLDTAEGYNACKEGDPGLSHESCRIASLYYRDHFMLFKAIQAAGPRLNPASVDRGMHAIPRTSSTSPYVASCFFDPGDYTCTKDAMQMWWDASGQIQGSKSPGCWRMVNGGKRSLAGEWPPGDEVFSNREDPCNGYAAGTGT